MLLFFIASSSFSGGQAQNNADVSILIDKCVKQVDEIDNQLLYKTKIDNFGYRQESNNHINELLAILYFDEDSTLIKSRFMMSFEISGIGYYERYFDKNGNVIHSILNASFGPDGRCSAARCISREDELMHIDFASQHNENQGLISERIIRIGKLDLPMPILANNVYDNVDNIDDLQEENRRLFNVDSLYLPNKTVPVKFVLPQVGDTTYIRRNSVSLYESPDDRIVDKVDICDVIVLEINNGWCKVQVIEQRIEGYINSNYLAPVEKEIEL